LTVQPATTFNLTENGVLAVVVLVKLPAAIAAEEASKVDSAATAAKAYLDMNHHSTERTLTYCQAQVVKMTRRRKKRVTFRPWTVRFIDEKRFRRVRNARSP
jgi:imidazolonepropionase-like amidohydrolase